MMKKGILIALFFSLFLTNNIYANTKEVYACTFDSVYWVGRGKSVETNGGELLVTVTENDLVIKSSSLETSGTHNLKLSRESEYEIFATNDSMQFVYSKNSHNFNFMTGIGASGFSVAGGGHMGRQVRVAGKCSKN